MDSINFKAGTIYIILGLEGQSGKISMKGKFKSNCVWFYNGFNIACSQYVRKPLGSKTHEAMLMEETWRLHIPGFS